MDIGFVGLGTMGSAMATRLVRAGHRVRVWNRSADPITSLLAIGAERAAAVTEVAEAQCLISMLADDRAMREALLDGAVLQRLRPGSFHVNMATVSVALARELTALHEKHGSGYLAAPVVGRREAAAAGELTILVAGAPQLVAEAQPIFDVLGRAVWPMGNEPAQANAVKLAMNVMLVSAIQAMAEATALTEAHGVHAKAFLELATATLFPGPAYRIYGALLAKRRYDPAGFKLALAAKDVRLALEASNAAHVHMPFATILRDCLLEAIARGAGDLDLAALDRPRVHHS
jgi:3-hydroxyisobutyrate dehydrogenase-like beta-hydroxyacid dehydrogenase